MTETPERPLTGYEPIDKAERQSFNDDGWLLIPNALTEEHRLALIDVVDAVYAEEAAADRLRPGGAMHVLEAVYRRPEITALLTHPATFRYVWGLIGWNTYCHHSHIDVNPPAKLGDPFWNWHQDGYRQNSDIDADPRPMLALKVCFVLSDMSLPGRGATKIIPGAHVNNTLAKPDDLSDPPGAQEIIARAGDAFVFDRRMWHSRSVNVSEITRKLIFVGYTHRWIRPLDETPEPNTLPWYGDLDPIQKQLLGEGPDRYNYWGIKPDGWLDDSIPLRAELKRRELLEPTIPYLR
jgi:hypothetical protein